jgi:hypothetical protein
MDLSELSNGASIGEAQKVEDSPEHAWSIPVPFVLLLWRCRAFLLLRFSTLSQDTGLAPFLPYLPQISVDLSTTRVLKNT